MEFKLKEWAHADVVPPVHLHAEVALRFGEAVARMTVATPPLVRAFHRMAFDLNISPRGRTLAMCAVTYLISPMDHLHSSNARPAETLVDGLYVAWRSLSEILDLHGPGVLEKHWRSGIPTVDVLALLESLPVLEHAVPSKVMDQIGQFLQLAMGR